MKKRSLFFFLLLSITLLSRAQQSPQYSQYMLNNYLLNPAVTGIENYTDLKGGFRSQWTGLKGAPVTSYLTINAPLGGKFTGGDAAAFSSSGNEDPASRSLTRLYQAAEHHHGIGMMLVSDKTGPVTTTTLNFSYAYHLGLTARLNLAMGFSAGLSNLSLNKSEITLADPNDPVLRNGISDQWKPDLGAGLWLYSPEFYTGLSAQQLIPNSLSAAGSVTARQPNTLPAYFMTAGVKLFLSDQLSLLPSFLLSKTGQSPLSYDINLKLSWLDRLWTGISYRKNESFSALLGININSLLNIGYSYDMTLSTLNKVSNGSHEIVLGLLLNNKYGVRCPQRSF